TRHRRRCLDRAADGAADASIHRPEVRPIRILDRRVGLLQAVDDGPRVHGPAGGSAGRGVFQDLQGFSPPSEATQLLDRPGGRKTRASDVEEIAGPLPRRTMIGRFLSCILISVVLVVAASARAGDPLVSWNDGPTKKSIYDFVAKVTTNGSPDFVKPAERIA